MSQTDRPPAPPRRPRAVPDTAAPRGRAAAADDTTGRELANVIRLPGKRYQDGMSTEGLSEVQQAALSLLLDDQGFDEVAVQLGVDTSVVYRWVSYDKRFSDALIAAQERRRKLIQLKLERASLTAVATLEQIAADTGKPARDRVAASVALLRELQESVVQVPSGVQPKEEGGVAAMLKRAGVVIPAGAARIVDTTAEVVPPPAAPRDEDDVIEVDEDDEDAEDAGEDDDAEDAGEDADPE